MRVSFFNRFGTRGLLVGSLLIGFRGSSLRRGAGTLALPLSIQWSRGSASGILPGAVFVQVLGWLLEISHYPRVLHSVTLTELR